MPCPALPCPALPWPLSCACVAQPALTVLGRSKPPMGQDPWPCTRAADWPWLSDEKQLAPVVWGSDAMDLNEATAPVATVMPRRSPDERPCRRAGGYRQELRAFIDLPFGLYRQDPFWGAPLRGQQRRQLDQNRNPFFQEAEAAYFLARRDGRPVGRISAHLDHRYNQFHSQPGTT
jgi:hypothetical protein